MGSFYYFIERLYSIIILLFGFVLLFVPLSAYYLLHGFGVFLVRQPGVKR